jgi:hypothetical protein
MYVGEASKQNDPVVEVIRNDFGCGIYIDPTTDRTPMITVTCIAVCVVVVFLSLTGSPDRSR